LLILWVGLTSLDEVMTRHPVAGIGPVSMLSGRKGKSGANTGF
jgi:hypothetical protein